MRFEIPEAHGRYSVRKLDESCATDFCDFLFRVRSNHWALSSSAFARKPQVIRRSDPIELLEDESSELRIGTFVLFDGRDIIGSMKLDYSPDRSTVIFSNTEADPAIQRRGLLAMLLARPCLLEALTLDVTSFQMTTWAFNRKAFPLYAKAGFRIVPNTSVRLISFFPLLYRQLRQSFANSRRRFLDAHVPGSFLAVLSEEQRSHLVFSYAWKTGLKRDVYVDVVSGSVRIQNPELPTSHYEEGSLLL